MAVKLDFLQSNVNLQPSTVVDDYLYKDIMLDLSVDYTRSFQLLKDLEVKDIKSIFDYEAVAQSLRNIFQTLPGQKILNPTFGIDLRRYLFAPVNDRVAYIIGLDLLDNIPMMEPRVIINKLNVSPNPDSNEYIITIKYGVPALIAKNGNIQQLNLTLDKNGFQII